MVFLRWEDGRSLVGAGSNLVHESEVKYIGFGEIRVG